MTAASDFLAAALLLLTTTMLLVGSVGAVDPSSSSLRTRKVLAGEEAEQEYEYEYNEEDPLEDEMDHRLEPTKFKKQMVLPTRLVTPTLWVQLPDGLACNLSNVSDRTKSARVFIVSEGQVVMDSGLVVVEPTHTADIFTTGLEDGLPMYCDFRVEGSKSDWRGAVKNFPLPNGSDFAVLPTI